MAVHRLMGQFVRRVTYPLNELREGTAVLPQLRFLEGTERADPERLHSLRLRKLHALLDHAFRNTEFYRRRFQEAGISPGDIRDFDDLRLLPPLTKKDIVQRQSELIAKNLRPVEMHRTVTGGSTGTHTPFYRDNASLNIKRAAELRFNRWCGWELGEKIALVWPAIQDLPAKASWKQRVRNVLLDRSLFLSSGKLNDEVMSQLAARLDRFSPVLLRAAPYSLAIFAEYIRDATSYRIRPGSILTTAEPLLAQHRTLFEDVFGCPVFDCYASREVGHTACECEAHDGMHINAECLHVEFEMNDRPVRPGELGYMLITDLDNYGMPFVRYDIGDIGSSLAGSCSCGRTLPRMGMNAGRDSDFFCSPHDGSLIMGAICHELIAHGPDVGQMQIVQDDRDHMTIRMKMNRLAGDDAEVTEHVRKVIDRVFHGTMRVSFEQVEFIPREKSGKFRVCVNEWQRANQEAPADDCPIDTEDPETVDGS